MKVLLSLFVIAITGAMSWHGYLLFTEQLQPVKGSAIFIIGVAVLVVAISLLRRRYASVSPSFKLTAFAIIAVAMILAFAGVQPLVGYKDMAVSGIRTAFQEWEAGHEGLSVEVAAVKAETRENERIEELEKGVVELVNSIRGERGIAPLIWDNQLYGYAKAHSKGMAEAHELYHSSMYEDYAENAWYGSGRDWDAIDIVEGWMESPKHRTWLLCPSLSHVAVGISGCTYASWTFWKAETIDSDWWYSNGDTPPYWWY